MLCVLICASVFLSMVGMLSWLYNDVHEGVFITGLLRLIISAVKWHFTGCHAASPLARQNLALWQRATWQVAIACEEVRPAALRCALRFDFVCVHNLKCLIVLLSLYNNRWSLGRNVSYSDNAVHTTHRQRKNMCLVVITKEQITALLFAEVIAVYCASKMLC